MSGRVLYHGSRVLLDDSLEEAGIIVGVDGKIEAVLRKDQLRSVLEEFTGEVVDLSSLTVMPGIVDSHVHVNEPGRTEWEGYWTATRAAAAGGVTTIVDMPLNSIPPTTSVENLKAKLQATKGKLHVDVGFWGGVIPGNQDDLKAMVAAGVVGFKCFLCPSGVDEFPHVSKEDVEQALKHLQGTDSVLAFHAECDTNDVAVNKSDEPEDYSTFLKSRPASMEVTAVKLVAQLCAKYNVRCHVVHLSACAALPTLRAARHSGAQLTVETCYHYLTLTSENIPRHGVQYKCCPPVRDASNKEELWTALKAGDLDMVVSDHSPCSVELKKPDNSAGDFMRAWGGISSLQFGLSLFWTEARERGFGLADVSRLLSRNPARLVGLDKVKGRIALGMDADFVVWDPLDSFVVEESTIEHKHKLTPYLGRQLYGKVIKTIVRGNTVYQRLLPFCPPRGQILLKSRD